MCMCIETWRERDDERSSIFVDIYTYVCRCTYKYE